MIHDMQDYVSYFNGVRKRTMKYVEVVPDSILEWRPAENKFTTGDLLRHIGSAQRMFLTIFENGKWIYLGHDASKGQNLEGIIHYLNSCHTKYIEGMIALGNQIFEKKVQTLHGYDVSPWRILMAAVEHEVHHRGQLSTYLQMNGINPPQIFDIKIEAL